MNKQENDDPLKKVIEKAPVKTRKFVFNEFIIKNETMDETGRFEVDPEKYYPLDKRIYIEPEE